MIRASIDTAVGALIEEEIDRHSDVDSVVGNGTSGVRGGDLSVGQETLVNIVANDVMQSTSYVAF